MTHQRGFTLIEVLVTTAIVGLLVAMLLPAVQAAREAARRVHCQNNLKQIGVAVHHHLHSLNAYPGGGWKGPVARTKLGGQPTTFETQNWSWPYQILPFLEQQPLWENPSDGTVAGTPVQGFFCPTRRPPTVLQGGYWASNSQARAQIDYAGNAGTSAWGGISAAYFGLGRDGVMCAREVGFRRAEHIVDGASMTPLVGEKRMNVRFCTTDQQPDDNDGFIGGFQDDVIRWGAQGSTWGDLVPAMDFSGPAYTDATLRPSIHQFGSSHASVTFFVYCDGSVRAIGFDVAPLAFHRLCSIRDGGVVDTFGL